MAKMKRDNLTFDVDKTIDVKKFEADGWTLIKDTKPASNKGKKGAKPEPEAAAEAPEPEPDAAE